MAQQQFRAEGQSIWVEPVEKVNADGSISITLGFELCRMAPAGKGNAEAVAQMLSLHSEMLEALKAIRDWILFSNKVKDPETWLPAFRKANNLANEVIAKAEAA